MIMITFDIETIPTTNPEVIFSFEDRIKPPGNIKLAETRDKWISENKHFAINKMIAETSFNGMYGNIACIAWDDSIDDERGMWNTKKHHTEEQVIRSFYDYIDDSLSQDFCGHNIVGFDLPFLKHRSMILGIKPPDKLLKAMNAAKWDSCVKDTMLMWSQDRSNYISKDDLCRAFGIDINDEIDGSMVAETWSVDPDKVIRHCIADVQKTVLIYKRMAFI